MAEMLDPGNIGKGFCLKCKTPLDIILPDENAVRIFCVPCTKDIKERVKAAKNNPNAKRMVIDGKTAKRIG